MPYSPPYRTFKEQNYGRNRCSIRRVSLAALLTRPPDEVPEQSEASIGAMRQLGKLLDETKPDAIIFLGSDHLDTFSMTCVPTFAIICGNRVIADHVGHHYDLPNHREMAEDLLEQLI